MRDIPGYEGLYKVDANGAVYNTRGLLKVPQYVNGYQRVALCKDGKRKVFLVHRIVAMVYIPNVLNKPRVNHKNLIRSDNRVENLEWCTSKENTAHAIQNGSAVGRRWDDRKGHVYVDIKKMLGEGSRIIDISRFLDVSYQTVSNIKYGISHKYLNQT